VRGYFPSDSVIRRVANEPVLMLGGGRALLMQAAHPLVAAGIVGYSGYREEPLVRLARTMRALYTIVFGTKTQANAAGETARRAHVYVRGRLREDVGPFAAGTPYAAGDPELQLWVHATLVDTGIAMYDACVRRLDDEEKEAFHREMRVVARVFGVPERVLPGTYAEFEDYRRGLLAGEVLTLGADARAVANVVLDPPVPLPLKPGARALARASVGLLPAELLERYGVRRGLVDRAVLTTSRLTARRLVGDVWADGREGKPLRLLATLAHAA
jgi:uncharacterized protein (DUF2236 family)